MFCIDICNKQPLGEELHSVEICFVTSLLNTLRPRQNGRRFADNTFKRIFLNENVRILIKISMKFVPKGPITNNPTLVQIMACRRSGDKPLSEPMMVSLLTHICVTRPQWVNLPFRHWWKKTSKLHVTGLCERNSPVNSPHKGPVAWKIFPFDDIMSHANSKDTHSNKS